MQKSQSNTGHRSAKSMAPSTNKSGDCNLPEYAIAMVSIATANTHAINRYAINRIFKARIFCG